jgi:hypothetical protein
MSPQKKAREPTSKLGAITKDTVHYNEVYCNEIHYNEVN